MDEGTRKTAARCLGMKIGEIIAVAQAEDGGLVITTHDGQTVCAHEAGEVRPWVGPPPIRFPGRPAEVTTAAVVIDEPQPDPGPEPVPDGTAAEVLAWVGEDPARALRAAKAEEVASKPRSGLLAQLTKLAGL